MSAPNKGEVGPLRILLNDGHMQTRAIEVPELRWAALSSWALAWDPFLENHHLEQWAAGLSMAAAGIDQLVLWYPESNLIVAPAARTDVELTACLRDAIRAFTGIDHCTNRSGGNCDPTETDNPGHRHQTIIRPTEFQEPAP